MGVQRGIIGASRPTTQKEGNRLMSRRLLCSKSRTEKFRYLYDTPDVPTIQRIGQGWTVSSVREALKYYFAGFFPLTLFAPAYLSISKDRGETFQIFQ